MSGAGSDIPGRPALAVIRSSACCEERTAAVGSVLDYTATDGSLESSGLTGWSGEMDPAEEKCFVMTLVVGGIVMASSADTGAAVMLIADDAGAVDMLLREAWSRCSRLG